MSEWGVSPQYVLENWSGEFLALMLKRLGERRKAEASAFAEASADGDAETRGYTDEHGLTQTGTDDGDVEEISPEEMMRRLHGG